ncbi:MULTISPECIES: hemerythrin domain-containing protein [unclassified Streptomyces]|uniref:hemerythrin domain-containing protein n=1 Tax=unclassified Streptomyces TaxID=2593676 RepID=UPI001BE978F5|nr:MULTISPECIES: hemerythrin domain-containing protein [unclassified Streptomyces]MBT2408083.1 hemerythrin domain-containing protein [Streptomyces sp. ISL-21]MBT2455784.1 hemerythrin domain-containing protein [Streptomyces sp. ISL-86]MBT2609533.1 hemerythrin domain-containing protein [Streptomyces sp. ISL-87]
MGHGGDVIAELTADHREVEEMFDVIEHTTPANERQTAAERLTIELVRHSVAEEEHLYPAIRERFPDGDLIADKEIADHARVEKMLKDLEGLDAAGPEFDRRIAVLKAEVSAHVRDEEENLFPRLRQACSPEALNELGDKVRRAKTFAPTRPHPGAPATPPANRLLAPGVGLVDRARDYVTGRGK